MIPDIVKLPVNKYAIKNVVLDPVILQVSVLTRLRLPVSIDILDQLC